MRAGRVRLAPGPRSTLLVARLGARRFAFMKSSPSQKGSGHNSSSLSELAARRTLHRIALLVLFGGLGDLLLGVVRVPRPLGQAHRFLFGGGRLFNALPFLCHGY